MKITKFKAKLSAILLIPIGILLVNYSSLNADAVERIYSKITYAFIGQPLSLFTGIFPFSIAELIIILVPLSIILYIVLSIKKSLSQPEKNMHSLLNCGVNLIMTFSIVFFLFIGIWGLNYYRQPFALLAGLDVKPSSTEELIEVCETLIERANELRAGVNENNEGIMDIEEDKYAILRRCIKGYSEASKLYPELGGYYGNPKPVLLSKLMSYTGISGIYFPFTAEANVNVSIPDSMIPCTASHEMAHQRGFAREDEANYIAYLTCSLHPDVDFKYSGTLLAVINAMNALYKNDPDSYFKLGENYSKGVVRDIKAIDAFWNQFEGPIERASDRLNNAYLKANKQKDGVQSYGRMVDLLIAEHRISKSR